ncbi:MAG: hypothetical protein ACK4IY_04165 [Chitinophagales bacterium]
MRIIFGVAITLAFAACKKEPLPEINPPISKIPYIEFISVDPTTVIEYQDSIIFRLFYQDGDGDLGYQDPDINSLYLIDTRIFTVEKMHIPLLAPENANVAIQGELIVKLDRTILIDPTSTSETVVFKLQIQDRAGNFSNYIDSPPITVLPYAD